MSNALSYLKVRLVAWYKFKNSGGGGVNLKIVNYLQKKIQLYLYFCSLEKASIFFKVFSLLKFTI